MSNLLKYDLIYILDPNATVEEQTTVSAKVEQVTADFKGTVLKKDDWGKRHLAYLVQKHREGHYIFFHLSLPPNGLAEITRNLRLFEKVIKFQVVKDDFSHLKAPVRAPREGSKPVAPKPLHQAPVASPDAPAAPAPVAPTPAPAE